MRWLYYVPRAVAVVIILHAAASLAAVFRVPEEYPAIQPALDAASPGDTVEVGPGTYSGPLDRNLTFGGKDLVLRSRDGAEQTIIDCSGNGEYVQGLELAGPLSRAAIVEGLTFQGTSGNGVAIIISDGARPTIRGCRVLGSDCTCFYQGGAPVTILLGAYPRFENCVLRDNVNWSERGGAISLWNAASAELSGCTLAANINTGPGGAISTEEGGTLRLEDCVLAGNRGTIGGAIYTSEAQSLDFVRCVFTGNLAWEEGGAIYAIGTGRLNLESSTVTSNRADSQYGGGGIVLASLRSTILRSIVSGNCGSPGREIYAAYGSVSIDCSAVPRSGVEDVNGVVHYLNMSVAFPPLFCDAPDCPQWDPFETGDFHLRSDSPCLARFAPCGVLIGALDEGCTAPAPVGACCIGLGCYLRTRAACETEAGRYQGDGVSCFPAPCVVIPVEETSWGKIKARFR